VGFNCFIDTLPDRNTTYPLPNAARGWVIPGKVRDRGPEKVTRVTRNPWQPGVYYRDDVGKLWPNTRITVSYNY